MLLLQLTWRAEKTLILWKIGDAVEVDEEEEDEDEDGDDEGEGKLCRTKRLARFDRLLFSRMGREEE